MQHLADVSGQARGPLWQPWLSERDAASVGAEEDVEWPSGEGFACVLFLVHVSESYFSYILLKRRLLPLLPLSASALHLHVLLRVLKESFGGKII